MVMQINIKNVKYNVTGRNDKRKQTISMKYISSPLKSGKYPLLICLQRLLCLPMAARYDSIEVGLGFASISPSISSCASFRKLRL